MSLKIIITFLLLLVSSLYVAFLNPYDVAFKISESLSFNIPLIIIIMISFFAGVLALFILNLFLSSGNAVKGWKVSRRKKRLQKIEEMVVKGKNFLFRGKSGEAYSFLKKALKKNPDHIDALHTLGDIYREQGKYHKAIDLHSKAYVSNKDNIELLYSLASDYEKAGNLKEASAIYEDIKNIDNNTVKPLYKLRKIYVNSKKWKKACQTQTKILSAVNGSDYAELQKEHTTLCKYYIEYGWELYTKKDYLSAKKEIKKAIKTEKKFIPAYTLMSEILFKEGKTRAAERMLKSGYKNTASAIFLKKLEETHISRKTEKKMIGLYKKAISSDSNNPMLNLMLAELYMKCNMLDESLNELQDIEKHNSNLPLLHKIKGAVFEKKDDITSAAKEYRAVVENGSLKGLFFSCSNCGFYSQEWTMKCPKCRDWNSITHI